MQPGTPAAGVAAAEEAMIRATWRLSLSTSCRRMAKLENHPLRQCWRQSYCSRATNTTLPLPFALAFVGAGRRGSKTGRAADGRVGWRRRRTSSRGNMLLLLFAGRRHRVESCGRRQIDLSLHVELLKLVVVPVAVERGKQLGVLDEGLHVDVFLVELTKKLEDKVEIRQLLT
jgi:hypothetical protein